MRVDLDGLCDLLRIVLVMRAVVMAVGNADVAVAAIAAFARQHEGDHAGQIRLVGDHHQIHHQPGVIDELFRERRPGVSMTGIFIVAFCSSAF